jgi:putative glutamine amidotransferase
VLRDAGAISYLVPPPAGATSAVDVLDGLDGLMLIGGEDVAAEVSGAAPETIGPNADADRDRWEIQLLITALETGVPVLAICRGMQLLNIAFGGTLHGHMVGTSVEHPTIPDDLADALDFRHRVDLAPGSRLRATVGVDVLHTNSLHHQSVDQVGSGLVVTAASPDGVVEALETSTSTWCVGVQWHPELMPDDVHQRALVTGFVDTCRGGRERASLELSGTTSSTIGSPS